MTEPAARPSQSPARRYRVLLVEDDDQHAQLAALWIEAEGRGAFELRRAGRLSSALASLAATPADAVLLDLSLPDSDRLETFRAVRAQAPGVPVVLMTGIGDQQLALQAVAEGAQDYLVKGDIDGQLLVRALHYAIERHRAEEAERKLLEGQRLESLSVLAGGLAHQLNNLLLVMMGNLDLALNDLGADDPVRRYLAEAERAAEKAARLSRQLLAFSGRGRLAIRPIALNEIIVSVADSLSRNVPPDCAIECRLDPALPPIVADEGQLAQLLVNLISNALEAMAGRRGTVVVATRVVQADAALLARAYLPPDLPAGPYVSLEVQDGGEGIAPETQAHMFEPFFSTRFTGRGLGLAAVHGIARGHRGAVIVTSTPGAGTTVQVLLPPAPGSRAEPERPS